MQNRSVRFIAVFAVLAMVFSPFAVMMCESESSEAAGTDYKSYYYDQLEPAGKWIYDSVRGAYDFQYTFSESFSVMSELHITSSDLDKVTEEIGKQLRKGTDALSIEQPKAIYWLKLSYKCGVSTSDPKTSVSNVTVSVTFDKADYDSFGLNKAAADGKIDTKLNDIKATLGTGNTESKIKIIHDTVCNMLTYEDSSTSVNKVRSLYTALIDDGKVVCEGYAKTFKAICDASDIPCLILTGDAGSKEPYEAHMWNYVMLENECWYLIDATWDDQSTVTYEYFLAGTDTVGFNGTKIGVSHDPTRGESSTVKGYGFSVPTLSMISASDPSFIVTFMNGTEVFRRIAVKENQTMTFSEKPEPQAYFLCWCTDAALTTPWKWDTSVTGDMTLYAKYTAIPVRINLVDGNDTNFINVEKNIPTLLDQLPALSADNKKFLGWNTAKDGTGIYYLNTDTVALEKDMNLYAVWEVQSTDPVNQTLNQINEFLAGESVIKGVSNTVLAIGVCSGVLLLIGFLLIAVKK